MAKKSDDPDKHALEWDGPVKLRCKTCRVTLHVIWLMDPARRDATLRELRARGWMEEQR